MDRREFLSWLMQSPLGLQNSWRELPSAPTVDIPRLIGEMSQSLRVLRRPCYWRSSGGIRHSRKPSVRMRLALAAAMLRIEPKLE
jgi:hypothetical protein